MIPKFIQRILCSMPFSLNHFWHGDLRIVRKLSKQSELIECLSCGRMFAINHDVRAILPWESVRTFYEDDLFIDRPQIVAKGKE